MRCFLGGLGVRCSEGTTDGAGDTAGQVLTVSDSDTKVKDKKKKLRSIRAAGDIWHRW